MRSSTRFIEAVLLGAGAWFGAGCSDQVRGVPDMAGQRELPLGQDLGAEVEPNATIAQATAIGNDVVVRANAMPDNDVDFFRFSAEPGTRVYVATATAFSTAGDQADNDTVLDLIGTNGTTVIQSDDDNGSISAFASSIAGASIATRGNYYLRVRGAGTVARQQVRPYDLHFRLRDGSPVAETEPNDTVPTAKALPGSGWVSGTMSDGDDIDYFSLPLAAGDTVFLSLDLDPERDASTWDAVLGFGLFGGTLLAVDSDDLATTPSETLVATVKYPGTYYVGIAPFDTSDFGNYHLNVSVHPATAASASCTTYTSTDVPKTITDNTRTLSTISVPGNPRIEDLDVSLTLSHARPTDLDVHLRSPSGNDNALFTNIGSDTFPNIDLTLDDEAAFPLTPSEDFYFSYVDDTALSGLSVQPETSTVDDPSSADPDFVIASGSRLGWFDGENAGGTWTLVMDDDETSMQGTLQSWAITVCEPPARVCPNGSPLMSALSATFESGAQGFTTSGTLNQWARGTPSGPASFVGCNGGTQCWKTNLNGDYLASSTSNLISPAINLTNAVAPITLEFAMKYQIESATFDHAWVEVRDMAAARNQRVWEFTDATMIEVVGSADEVLEETAGWGTKRIDVSAFAGRTIQIVFHLDADDGLQLGGFAIDDVSVAHCGCGDGLVGPGEQCDAGAQNGQPGRCCSATCQYVTNGTGCSDGSACTANEVCTNGACGGGSTVSCNDGNVCTNDSCDPGSGCAHANNALPCPGGLCQAGMCQIGGSGGGGAGGAGGGGGAGGAGNGGVAGTTAGGAGNGGVAGATAGGAGNGGVAGATAGGAGNGGVAGTTAGGAGNGGVAGSAGRGGNAGAAGTAGASGGTSGGGGRAQGGTGNPGGADDGGNGPEGGTGQGAAAGEGGETLGGTGTGATAGVSGRSGTSGTAGEGGEGGEGASGPTSRHVKDISADSTCGCRVPGKSRRGEVPVLLALALGAAGFRRRVHRRAA